MEVKNRNQMVQKEVLHKVLRIHLSRLVPQVPLVHRVLLVNQEAIKVRR